MPVRHGVPQGSILGPLIFVLYINGLPLALQGCDTFLYADDSALVRSGNSVHEINTALIEDLNVAANWLSIHKLGLNLSKTKMMYFGTETRLHTVHTECINYEGGDVDVVKNFKYLGMMLDGKLKFDAHVDYMSRKIYPKLKTLGKVRCYIGMQTALTLFNSLIAPLFNFIDYIFDPLCQKDADKLQVLHNNCLRMCLKCDSRTPRKELYERSKVLPLESQRMINTCCMVYKGVNDQSTRFVNNMFNHVQYESHICTRSSIVRQLEVPWYRHETAKRNIQVRGPLHYNGTVDKFFEEYEEHLTCLPELCNYDYLALVDSNIDFLVQNGAKKKLMKFLKSHNMDQMIRNPTRITTRTQTCIDHIYSNNVDLYAHCGVVDPGLSDHCLTYIVRKHKKPSKAKKTIRIRNYCHFSETSFQYDVKNTDWSEVTLCDDIDTAVERFNIIFTKLLDKHMPWKKIRVRINTAHG